MVEHADAAPREDAWQAWLKERPQFRELAFGWATQVPCLVDAVRGGSNACFNREWPDGQAEIDYFAMLNDRGILEDKLAKLPRGTAEELRAWLNDGLDAAFRDATEDAVSLATRLAWLDDDDSGWWWSRAPKPSWLRDAIEREAGLIPRRRHPRAT